MGDEDTPKLKKFPACWSVFSHLCEMLSSHVSDNYFLSSEISHDDRVCVMQSFLWLGDEKPLIAYCKALFEAQNYSFVRAILVERKTSKLTLDSKHGLAALDEMISIFIELSRPSYTSNLRTLRKKIFTSLANQTDI